MNIKIYLEEKRVLIDRFLESLFMGQDPQDEVSSLQKGMRYSLLAGGKRIRPILTLAAFEACGGRLHEEQILPVGAAFEMVHTYSLIHDDLPAMDNDDLRRGRPTNHKVFGDAMAILAGDALLTEAFALLSGLPSVPSKVLLRVIHELAVGAGVLGMAGGQAIDLSVQGKKISSSQLEELHRLKTGCLIRAAVVAGGLIAEVDEEKMKGLCSYGEQIGLAFQIADDILDVEGGSEEMGKPVHGDAAKSKATYPAIRGLEVSRKLALGASDSAIASLNRFDSRADPLREIARFIVSRRC